MSISLIAAPRFAKRAIAASYSAADTRSPKNTRWPVIGTPMRRFGGSGPGVPMGRLREYGTAASGPAIAVNALQASSTVRANTETRSSVRQAGTVPAFDTAPRLGFSPTMLPRAAGTRPEPAVSVPSANGTRPAATATAEPELDPPGISFALNTLRGTPYGERTPTRPVANWSRLVLPIGIAPAARSRLTQVASAFGV